MIRLFHYIILYTVFTLFVDLFPWKKNRSFIEICIPTYVFMNYIAMANSYHVFKYQFKNEK